MLVNTLTDYHANRLRARPVLSDHAIFWKSGDVVETYFVAAMTMVFGYELADFGKDRMFTNCFFKIVGDRLMQCFLIAFYGEHVVAFFVDYNLSDFLLASHRVDRYGVARDID